MTPESKVSIPTTLALWNWVLTGCYFPMAQLIQPKLPASRSTRSLSLVTLAHPPTSSSLWLTDRSFQYAWLFLWNELPVSPCQLRTNRSNSNSSLSLFVTPSSSDDSMLSSSTSLSLFRAQRSHVLPTVCFFSFLRTDSMDVYQYHYLWADPFLFPVLSLF